MSQRVTFDKLQDIVNREVYSDVEDSALSVDDLFPRQIMRTGYFYADSIEGFFEESPIDEPTGEYLTVSSKEFDEYVQENTVFDSWRHMLRYGVKEWVAREWAEANGYRWSPS